MDFLFPDGLGLFQDDNAKIHRALVVEEWSMRTHACQGIMRSHFQTWLYPIKGIWDVLENTEEKDRLSCHQDQISAKD